MALSGPATTGLGRFSKLYRENPRDLILVAAMFAILIALFTPIPPYLLDFLLLANLSFSLMVLLLTFYTDKPISFSTFPSLLLITTLFRLSLNISATRLILNDASAGKVIESVGTYVVGGNYTIGLVVFFILVVVQYVVVTNGAQRVAEVAARFTLDSMPGKQMSIDADLNMGMITEDEARQRRGDIEREANFYGAMDGATKFVKGDAIAGIIIILIDIIGGLTVGVAQLGMSWSEALQTFTLLTVGDGIVTQIPSLVIAVATGILITRAATDARLGDELIRQLTSNPKVLSLVGITLALFIFAPGIPTIPVMILAAVFLSAAFFTIRSMPDQEQEDEEDGLTGTTAAGGAEDFQKLLQIFPVELSVGSNVGTFFEREGPLVLEQIQDLRRTVASTLGFVCQEIKVTDSASTGPDGYSVQFNGVSVGQGTLYADRMMAINPDVNRQALDGIQTKEPAYNLDAVWIEKSQLDEAKSLGYTIVAPETLLITHLQDLILRNGHLLLTRPVVEQMIESARADLGGLVDELIPTILTFADVQRVLQALLQERVSIRNTGLILECLVDVGRSTKDIHELTEKVREQLGRQIVEQMRAGNDELKVLTLDSELESQLLRGIKPGENGPVLVPEPMQIDSLISKITRTFEEQMSRGVQPILICSPRLRAPFKRFCERFVPTLSVLSVNEVAAATPLSTVGVIK